MKKIKNFMMLVTGSLMLVVASLSFAPAVFAADCPAGQSQASCDACEGIGLTGADCAKDGTGINKLIKTIINLVSAIVGVVAVVMMIIGGFKYITSGGDSNKVASAKNTIIYAIIGLIIVALAQFIVHFVINKADTVNDPDTPPAAVVLYSNKFV